jgi:acyl-CoA synthetase (AMP-forming)/AMP-acid ligase II
MLVSAIVRRNADVFADRDAVVEPGRPTRSWADLERRTNRLARVLRTLGLGHGDRLAVLAPNVGEHLELFFAEAKTGIIGAPMNIRLTVHELAAYCRYVEPAALVVHGSLADVGRAVAAAAPSIRHVVGTGAGHGFDLDLDTLCAAQDDTDPGVPVRDDDVYQLAATSGTTGVAKAVALTHRNAWAAINNWLAEIPVHEEGTNLQNIPLFFNPGGPAGLHPVLVKGGRTVLFPGFDPGAFCDAVPRFGVTHTILVPTMIRMVLDHPAAASTDFSTLRAVVCGGSPVSRDLLLSARPVLGNVFFPHYGMAETYSCGLVLRPENQHTDGPAELVARLGSAGKPNVLMEVRVVGEDGRDIAKDATAVGEVWLRGDTVADAYYRMPEETAASRSGDWFRSGDLATVDRDGFVTIVDRAKDVIITGGINVHGREVEEVVVAHPSVGAAAVIGLPDDRWGEVVHAIVVAAPGSSVDIDAVLAFCAERLAGYKRPRSIEVVDALPLSATGKVLKRELRAERTGSASVVTPGVAK